MRDREIETIVHRSVELRALLDREPLVLTIASAAELTGLSYSVIYRACLNKGVAVRFGVEWFVSARRLLDLLTHDNHAKISLLALERAVRVASENVDDGFPRLSQVGSGQR